MKKIFGLFLVIFALVPGCFLFSSCQSPDFLWCTSSGIVTYNRHTGQFEMIWEGERKQSVTIHDTIYICPDTTLLKP